MGKSENFAWGRSLKGGESSESWSSNNIVCEKCRLYYPLVNILKLTQLE